MTKSKEESKEEETRTVEKECMQFNAIRLKERIKTSIEVLFEPTEPSSLAFFRISFGMNTSITYVFSQKQVN